MKTLNEMLNASNGRELYKRISAIAGLYHASNYDLDSAKEYAHMNGLDSTDYTGMASKHTIFDFVIKVATKEKISLAHVILYDTKEEIRLNALTNSTMREYMDSGDDQRTAARKTAMDLFDGKTLVNNSGGIVYFITVNDSTGESILDIDASKYDASTGFFENGKMKISLANVATMLG